MKTWSALLVLWGFGLATGSAAKAECRTEGPRLTEAAIAKFIADPKSLLRSTENKMELLEFRASELAPINPGTLVAFRALIPTAGGRQQESIGRAFYRALASCRDQDVTTTSRLESWIKKSKSQNFLIGYRAAELKAEAASSVEGREVPTFAHARPAPASDTLMPILPRPDYLRRGKVEIPDAFKAPGL